VLGCPLSSPNPLHPRVLDRLFTSVVVQCIYAVLKRVIFAIDEEEPLSVALECQISYFADEGGLNGLLKHLGNSPWCEVLKVIQDGFTKIM